jgi:hypothetical protein
MGQHIAELIMESGTVVARLEVAEGFTPMSPATCEPFENLPGVAFASKDRFTLLAYDKVALFISLRHPGFPEILLCEDVYC